MTDTVFRTKVDTVEQAKAEVLPEPKEPTRSGNETIGTIEVPYLDYSNQHAHSYLVDHFKLGDTWNDAQGGFTKEIETIEGYIQSKIKTGEIANSIGAVKDLIKRIEKINNLAFEERPVVKLGVLKNYAEFMMKNAEIRSKLTKVYGNH